MNYLNPNLYFPESAVDQLIALGDLVVAFDSASTDYATIIANSLGSYAPSITKTALGDGCKADVAAATNLTAEATGNANHYAVLDTVNSVVLAVGESDGTAFTDTEPYNAPAFSINFPAAIAS